MIDRFAEHDMTKIAWIRLVVQIAQPGIVGTAVNGLTVERCFVACDTGGYLTSIDGNGLGDGILFLGRVMRNDLFWHCIRTNSSGLIIPNCNLVIRRNRIRE